MAYLALAFAGEGKTDYRLLPGLIRRSVLELCLRSARVPVDVRDEVVELRRDCGKPFDDSVFEAASREQGAFNLLFVHGDGGGDPGKVYRDFVMPLAAKLSETARAEVPVIGVVPIRELEAWGLVDGDALRAAYQVRPSDETLGLPAQPRQVESIADPKAVLEAACAQAASRRSGTRQRSSIKFDVMGETIALERLRQVPAFQRFEEDLAAALASLGLIDGRS